MREMLGVTAARREGWAIRALITDAALRGTHGGWRHIARRPRAAGRSSARGRDEIESTARSRATSPDGDEVVENVLRRATPRATAPASSKVRSHRSSSRRGHDLTRDT